MTVLVLGFVIAVSVGMTGIGGGSFTVPALLLILGLPPAEAVGTTFVYAGVLRLLAAPFYLATRQVYSRYFRLMVLGAVPGLVIGMLALQFLAKQNVNALIVLVVGILLTFSSGISFVPRAQVPSFARNNSRWLPWLAFPIGIESGFSSAGAGALGTVLLLNYSELSPSQVVGTDVLFGLVLAVIGAATHWSLGSINASVLAQLLLGGVPGVLIGCILSRKVSAKKLKTVVAAIAICAGLQLVWSGLHGLGVKKVADMNHAPARVAEVVRP